MNIVMIFSCFLSSHTVYFGGNFARLLEGLKCLRFALIPTAAEYITLISAVEREVTNLLSLLISVAQDFGLLAWVILVFISHT